MPKTLRGSLYIMAACFIWSLGNVVCKFFLSYVPPLPLTVMAASCMVLPMLFKRGAIQESRVALQKSPRDFLLFAWGGVVMGSVGWYLALAHMPVGLAISLLRLQPLFIIVLAGWWLKEKLLGGQIIFMVSALIGTTLLLWPKLTATFMSHQQTDWLPLLFIFISIIGYSISTVQGKILSNKKYATSTLIILRFGIGSFICLPLLFTVPTVDYIRVPWWAWVGVPVEAILSGTLGYIFYYRGLLDISASLSGFLEQFSPVFTIILSVLILHEHLGSIQYVGAIILIISMSMLGWLEHRAKIVTQTIPEK